MLPTLRSPLVMSLPAPANPTITTARLENGSFWFVHGSRSFLPRQQRRQLRNVGRDPARLVLRQNLGLQSVGFVCPAVDVRKRLPVGITNDVPAGQLFRRATARGAIQQLRMVRELAADSESMGSRPSIRGRHHSRRSRRYVEGGHPYARNGIQSRLVLMIFSALSADV